MGTIMRTVTVEWFRYEKDGKTCDWCAATSRSVEQVVRKMKPALGSVKINLEIKETILPEDQIALSNSVRVNGKDVMDILGEKKPALAACPSCSALTGKDVCCGTFMYKGRAFESAPEAMIEEAIIAQVNAPNVQLTAPDAVKGECDCTPGCMPTGVNS
jgi:hypothetical protein